MELQMDDNGMLILTRRVGEELCIGDDIRVAILGVHGGQVRIGLAAPRTVKIDRLEIRNRIREKAGLQPLRRYYQSRDNR